MKKMFHEKQNKMEQEEEMFHVKQRGVRWKECFT